MASVCRLCNGSKTIRQEKERGSKIVESVTCPRCGGDGLRGQFMTITEPVEKFTTPAYTKGPKKGHKQKYT